MDINNLQKKINFSEFNNFVVWKCEFKNNEIIKRKRSRSDSSIINCPPCNDCLKLDNSLKLCMHLNKIRSKSF